MSGIDVMMKSVIRAFGISPDEFISGLQGFINNVNATLSGFDSRLQTVEETSKQTLAVCEEILRYAQSTKLEDATLIAGASSSVMDYAHKTDLVSVPVPENVAAESIAA